ncbi:MAG TPA: MgtC/SapB family protein [Thermoanaerobaculia bacterium]|nr:MgtC/SapB family protein [Thermoanaerobaculia bacterium]
MAFLPPDTGDLVLRLLAATVFGGGVGIDREVRGKPAGMRTHALVALGAALVTVVIVRVVPVGIEHVNAISRVIQGIIAGVGFLGAGAILKSPQGEDVHGLTTAASIWFVAALGTACGTGQWIAALVGVGFAFLILIAGLAVEKIVRRIFGQHEP